MGSEMCIRDRNPSRRVTFEDDARFVQRAVSPERPRSPRIYERSRSYDQRRPMVRPFRRPLSQPDTGYLRSNRGRNTQGPTARFGDFGQPSRTPIPQRGGRNPSGQRSGPRCNKCGRAAHTNLPKRVRHVSPVSTGRITLVSDHKHVCQQ